MTSPRSSALLAGGEDTIVAVATPEGRGALAIVRLSGAQSLDIARRLGAPALKPRAATRVNLRRADTGELLDDAVVTSFVAPHSYTGEDVVELSTHGGRVAPQLVLAACIAAGARAAMPGEFTRRAVLNGRMDLVQAEAVAELIDARTRAMHRQALYQLDGALTERFSGLRNELLHLEALIAYDIDFPEEDDGPIAPERIAEATEHVRRSIERLLASAPRAAALRDGALVVIAGPPNAGKSSLFNALLGEARALVTPIAGTTRDAIEAVLDTPRMPLRLVDTAGLRTTEDPIERLGIEVSERYLSAAQVVIACGETPDDVEHTLQVVSARTTAPVVRVLTKADVSHAQSMNGDLAVSAKTGQHIDLLLERLQTVCLGQEEEFADTSEELVVMRERQRRGLETALLEIDLFKRAWWEEQLPPIVAAVHLHAAVEALDAVIGTVSVDDVLDRVFRDFCIGK